MADASEPLRVGLLVNTLQLPAWVRTVIADIQASQYARIVLVIKKDGPPRAPASLARRIWRTRSRLAYLAYRWLDERTFRTADDAFAREDAAGLLAQATLVRVTVKETRFCDYLSDEDIAQIREARPDVLLRFGFRILKGAYSAGGKVRRMVVPPRRQSRQPWRARWFLGGHARAPHDGIGSSDSE